MATKQPKLTPWYPATVKPARKGCYQVGYKSLDEVIAYPFPYHWFAGVKWADNAWGDPADGSKEKYRATLNEMYRGCYWRGLAEKPQ